MAARDSRPEPGLSGFGLAKLTRWVALFGGFVLVAVSAITVVSVIGRYSFGKPVTGDYEIIEFGVSVAVFAFLPFTHAAGNNIIASFFTAALPKWAVNILDAIQNIIFLAVIGFLVWRIFIGGIDKFETKDISMFLSLKVWWLHVAAVLGLTLLGWVAVWKIIKWREQ